MREALHRCTCVLDGSARIGKGPPASASALRQTEEAPFSTYVLQRWETYNNIIDALSRSGACIQECILLEYLASCTMHTMRCNSNCTP